MVVEEEKEEEEEEVTVKKIHHFIEGIFKRARFSAECNIIALVYINRIISTTHLPLHARNWRAVVLVALTLAQKVIHPPTHPPTHPDHLDHPPNP